MAAPTMIGLTGLWVQFALQDVVEVGRTPAGRIVPAARGAIEQVVSANDVVEGAETARPVRHGVDLGGRRVFKKTQLADVLVDGQQYGKDDGLGNSCGVRGKPRTLM